MLLPHPLFNIAMNLVLELSPALGTTYLILVPSFEIRIIRGKINYLMQYKVAVRICLLLAY